MTGEVECRYYGRDFTSGEMALLRALIAASPPLTRRALSREFCRRIGWFKPDGGLKDMMARVTMLAMHRDGLIALPPPRWKRGRPRPIVFGPDTEPPLFPAPTALDDVRPLDLRTVAVAVNDQGRREVLGMAIGASEAETFWIGFLRRLTRRGLRGVKLVIADDHKGLKAAATRILGATAQRCRVHFMRNLLAHAGKQGRRVVSAFVATAFAQDDADSAAAQWRLVADQLKPKAPKLAALMDEAQHDVLAYMSFPREHRQKLHSTNPLERLNGEIKRRTNVVGIFPNENAITRLVGAILLEQNDEWAVSRRYMTLESIAQTSDNLTLKLPTVAA